MITFSRRKLTALIAAPFIAGSVILGAVAAYAESATLTPDEINTLLVGSSMSYSGQTTGTQTWTETETEWVDSQWGPGTSKWWIDGEKYCYFEEPGSKKCGKWKSKGEGVYSNIGYKYTAN